MTRIAARLLAVLALAVGLMLGVVGAAAAHAELDSSSPQAGEVVAEAPATIRLSFNEPVDVRQGSLELLSADGQPAPASARVENGSTIVLTPAKPLAPGGWVVTWRLSSTDGHVVNGTLPFAVGIGSAVPEASVAGETPVLALALLEAAAWLAAVAAAVVIAGGLGSAATWLAMASLAASGLRLPVLAADAGGWDLALASGETRASILVVFSAVFALLASIIAGPPGRTRQRIAVGLGILGLMAFAAQGTQSGHHLLKDSPVLVMLQVAHLVAAALWIGAVLALALRRTREQALRTRRLATVSVLVLLPCALALTAGIVWTDPTVITSSTWGRLLIVKVAIVCIALVLGLLHHRALAPERIDTTLSGDPGLRRFLFIETGLLVLVLALAATMTTHSPFSGAAAQAPAEGAVAASSATTSVRLSDGHDATIVWSGTGGTGTWTVTVPGVDLSGADAGGTLQLTHVDSGTDAGEVLLSPAAGGALVGSGSLPLTGRWDLAVELGPGPFDRVSGTGSLEVAADSLAQPTPSATTAG